MGRAIRKLSFVLVIASAFMAQSAHAALIIYTTRSAWESAAGGPPVIFDNFNDITVDLDLDTPGVTRGSVTYSTPSGGGSILDGGPPFNSNVIVDGTAHLWAQLAVAQPSYTLTFSFSTPVTSWGADVNPAPATPGRSVSVATNGGDSGSFILPSDDNTEFRGFRTTDPFTSVTFSAATDPAGHGIDNVGAHPVPEPRSFAIAGLWALVGGLVLHWRNASAKKRGN